MISILSLLVLSFAYGGRFHVHYILGSTLLCDLLSIKKNLFAFQKLLRFLQVNRKVFGEKHSKNTQLNSSNRKKLVLLCANIWIISFN